MVIVSRLMEKLSLLLHAVLSTTIVHNGMHTIMSSCYILHVVRISLHFFVCVVIVKVQFVFLYVFVFV